MALLGGDDERQTDDCVDDKIIRHFVQGVRDPHHVGWACNELVMTNHHRFECAIQISLCVSQ